MVVTPDDHFLYNPTRDRPSIFSFQIHFDGTLTPVADPLPITVPHAIPFGVVFVDENRAGSDD